MKETAVWIRIHTTVRAFYGEVIEEGESTFTGTMSKRGEAICLKYQEYVDEEDPQGSLTDVQIMARPGKVIVMRRGAYESVFSYEKGYRFEGRYKTPFGDLPIVLYTNHTSLTQEKGGGEIHLDYIFGEGVNGMHHIMKIEYQMVHGDRS